MSIIQRTAFHANMNSCPVRSNIILEWLAGCIPRSYIFTSPALRSEYCTSSRCKDDWQKPIRYVTIEVQDRRGVASLRYKNSVEISILMCEKKLYPV